MAILSVWLISKSGGLVYQRDFHTVGSGETPADSATSGNKTPVDASAALIHPKLSTNDCLVLASTFQSMHAIATQLNPTGGKCSGIESIEWHGAATGRTLPFRLHCFQSPTGIKIVMLTSPRQPQLDYILRRIYEIYADYAMKNPFHAPEMPVRSERFETHLTRLVRQMSTVGYS